MTNYPPPPPTQIRSVEILTEGIWLWNWLPPVFASSTKVRPADMDGWVEQGGQILLLDGCLSQNHKPSSAVRQAVMNAKNITYVALLTDSEGFDPESRRPRYLTHYFIKSKPWHPRAYVWDRWVPFPIRDESRGARRKDGGMTDLLIRVLAVVSLVALTIWVLSELL